MHSSGVRVIADCPVEWTVDIWGDVLHSAWQIGMLTVQEAANTSSVVPTAMPS